MKQLFEASDVPAFLDEAARRFLAEARANYVERNLANDFTVDQGREAVLLTWIGKAANEALDCLVRRRGLSANAAGADIKVIKAESGIEAIIDALIDAAVDELQPLDMLLADVRNLQREKWNGTGLWSMDFCARPMQVCT